MIQKPDGFRDTPSGSRKRERGNSPQPAGLHLATCLAILFCLAVFWHRASAQTTPTDDAPPAAAKEAPQRPAPRGVPRDPIEVLHALGPFLYPLALTSIIVVWFSIERLVVLRRGRVIPKPFVRRFFEHLEEGKLDAKSALKLCEENGSPIAGIFAHGIRKWGKSSVEVEQAIIDGGERQLSQLRKNLRVLNGASTVAPLLGLLGTVVGMIESFNSIATKSAMGKSEELASGIGLALLTTAAGLIIAIPSLIMYMYLSGRVDALVIEMDGLSQDLVDMISAEGLAEQARNGPRSASITKPVSEPRKAV
jgi:biopolymer transport protein ExbB